MSNKQKQTIEKLQKMIKRIEAGEFGTGVDFDKAKLNYALEDDVVETKD